MGQWKGGILDNGGVVWCKYLKQRDDSYGVHTGGVTFWNDITGHALRIQAHSKDSLAAKFSHSPQNEFTCTHSATPSGLLPRYDLSRFVAGKADIFSGFKTQNQAVTVEYELQYVDYAKDYSRGRLPGIDSQAVRELLNTTGRYGVVDNNIVGGNGWLTNWKCLHEPFFAQIGLALNDPNYTRNLSATLDQERDQAMLADGRVLSRWHNTPGDEIPGTYNKETGYYEAQWGYTVDSQTGYVINTSEQFAQTGNLAWLRSHQSSCEKALDWLIRRDANQNGIFEMVTTGIAEQKASDWVDIVWASYENAFVNAQLYESLTLWADCEKALGNRQKAADYLQIAARLKKAFNQPLEKGGFWSEVNQQYVYWRDQDGSVHGDNLVTPVNFAAIAFGLCDDPRRINQILRQIEQRMDQEKLFHWPLCFDSFKREEVQGGNWPFPKYENGDIFPTWGYLGIRAYATYNNQIALRYVNNLLTQYRKDGLSSQRYSRKTQLGLGDDILAGISTTITALYRDIYGIRPKWNRMGLEPHMSKALDGTAFTYTLRDTIYQVSLRVGQYRLRTKEFSVTSHERFGVSKAVNKLTYFHHNEDCSLLQITAPANTFVQVDIKTWKPDSRAWVTRSMAEPTFRITALRPNARYRIHINHQTKIIKANPDGEISLKHDCRNATTFHVIKVS
ncbi:alpha-L-rhamnosidase-related protein [Spirosoma koreense]